MKVLAVIPARGGSKGVPYKNLKPLGDKPLLAWSVEAAKNAKRVTRCVVSTDDQKIVDAAKAAGADVPFTRPPELATDSARSLPVMVHALDALEKLGQTFDVAVMLQPTTPYRTAADLDGALELLERTGADSVISVVDVGAWHPARMKYLEGDRLIDPPFCEREENQPRQELPPMYIRNGAIYATKVSVLRGGSFKGKDCRAWVMPEQRSVNIDTASDFAMAEWQLGRP